MISQTSRAMLPPERPSPGPARVLRQVRSLNSSTTPLSLRFSALAPEDQTGQHQAEYFYLQKQIQAQTPMVIVLEDGEQIEGCIEWYDRYSLKVRGRSKMLIYKSAIKYMYKLGEVGP
jgi:RNA chaperone Hfq